MIEQPKKIGGCVGRNGYWGVYGFELDLYDDDGIDIIFKSVRGTDLNAGGHVDASVFVPEAIKIFLKLGYSIVKR